MSDTKPAKKLEAATRDSEPLLLVASTKPAKRRFWRRWLLGVVVLALVGGGAVAMQFKQFGGSAATLMLAEKTAQLVQNTVGGQPGTTEGLAGDLAGLALQGVNLFNGEKGAELWRLKATWARLAQEGDSIFVDSPVVRYTLGEPSSQEYLDVKSEKGTITDSQRYLSLTGNVDVRHMDDIMTGPRLDYDSKTRVMVFPEGAALESVRASGTADVFTWDLANNTMLAEGNVDVRIKPQEPSKDEPASTSAPGALSQETVTVPAVTPAVAPAKASAVKPAETKKKASTRSAANKTTPQKAAPKKTISQKRQTSKSATQKTSPTKKSAATTRNGS